MGMKAGKFHTGAPTIKSVFKSPATPGIENKGPVGHIAEGFDGTDHLKQGGKTTAHIAERSKTLKGMC